MFPLSSTLMPRAFNFSDRPEYPDGRGAHVNTPSVCPEIEWDADDLDLSHLLNSERIKALSEFWSGKKGHESSLFQLEKAGAQKALTCAET